MFNFTTNDLLEIHLTHNNTWNKIMIDQHRKKLGQQTKNLKPQTSKKHIKHNKKNILKTRSLLWIVSPLCRIFLPSIFYSEKSITYISTHKSFLNVWHAPCIETFEQHFSSRTISWIYKIKIEHTEISMQTTMTWENKVSKQTQRINKLFFDVRMGRETKKPQTIH